MNPLITKLPRQVVLLGWVSFLADVSSEMIYPLIPLFLIQVLGAPSLALGLIEGLAQAIVSLMSVVSGVISDRFGGRVLFVRWGYGLPIVGKWLISVAGTWSWVLVGRSIDRLGKGLRGSPRDALLADAISANRRGEAFGFHRMMDTGGAFVGVLIAAGLLWFLQGERLDWIYRVVFAVGALLALCSLLVTFFVKEGEVATQRGPDEKPVMIQDRQSVEGLGREYWITLAILNVFAFANSSDTFLLLRAADVGISALGVIMIYAFYNLTYSLFSYSAGKLSDQLGRWMIIVLGWGLYAFVYAGVAVADESYLWALFALYGVYMAMTEGVSKALILDCVPSQKKATALGFLYMSIGFSAIVSNLLAGYLWDRVAKSAPFWTGAGFAVLAIGIVVFSGRLKRDTGASVL